MKKYISGLAILALASISSTGFAGEEMPVPYSLQGSSSETDTQAYAGLKWTLGEGATPALVLGVMRAKVKSNGDTSGGNLSLDVNLAGTPGPGKLKLNYMRGKENVQGEAGVGYDFRKGAPLVGLGVNGPHVNAGVDFVQGGSMTPFVVVHTQGKFDKPGLRCAEQLEAPPEGTLLWWGDSTCSGPGEPYYPYVMTVDAIKR